MTLSATTVKTGFDIGAFSASLLTFLVSGAVAIALYGVIESAPVQITSRPYWDMWSMVAVTALAAWLLAAFTLPRGENGKFRLALSGLSVFMVVTVALALKGTPYAFDGVEADQRFYAAFVTKLAAQWGYGDAVYAGLPAFYPPLYFWLLARIAGVAAVEPYLTMKTGVLLTAFLMPYAATWLWERSVAFPVAVASAFAILFYQEWFKTAEWLSLVCFVPWWIYWVENSRSRVFAERRSRLMWWLAGGFAGALIFQTYYYWFFIGGISLIAQWIWSRARPEDGSRPDFVNALGVLAATALFSAPYWLPYLLSMGATGGWQPLQNRWLSEGKIPLPFPFLDGSLEGALLLGGLLYLALSAGSNRVSRGMLALVLAVYGWSALGFIGMLSDRPLLTFRAYTVLEYVLAVAAIMALAALWRISRSDDRQPVQAPVLAARLSRATPLFALLLVLFFSQESAFRLIEDEMVATARAAAVPSELVSAFDELTEGAYHSKVYLLGYDYRDLLAYRPVHTFIPWSAHFSHPAGLYRERVAFLEELAATTEPDLFVAALMNNRYSRIDGLLLEREDTAWRLRFLDDNFPDRTVERAFAFDERLFVEPYFESRQTGGLTLLSPHPDANPLAGIDLGNLQNEQLDSVALLYALVTTFGDHVDLPDHEATGDEAEKVLLAADLSTLAPETLLSLQLAANGELHDKASAALEATLQNPLNVRLVDEQGVERVRVIGYSLQPHGDGQAAHELALYFEALAPVEHDYTIWLHADQEGSQLNFDHTLNAPTSTWDTGKIYRDSYVISAEPGGYHITFGIWKSDEELRLRRPDGAIEIDLGTVILP